MLPRLHLEKRLVAVRLLSRRLRPAIRPEIGPPAGSNQYGVISTVVTRRHWRHESDSLPLAVDQPLTCRATVIISPLAQVGKELVELPNRARILQTHHDGRAIEPMREALYQPRYRGSGCAAGHQARKGPNLREGAISVNILSTEERNSHVQCNSDSQRASQRIEAETAGFCFRRPIRPKSQKSRRDEL
jgi:hypothetical protein